MRETAENMTRNVGSDIYGAARLELARHVKTALNEEGGVWFLDGGTLLGAYRDGKQIAHDDDFDIAMFMPDFKDEQDLIALKESMMRVLPAPYEIRTVTSYAYKLEVFDPRSELYPLPPHYHGADFHTVTVDVQIMTDAAPRIGEASTVVVYLHELLRHIRVPKDSIEPVGQIVCEGCTFNCPRHIARFLEAQYGYIGADARFDEPTSMYVKA